MIPLCLGLDDFILNLDVFIWIFIIGAVFFIGTLFIAYDLLLKHEALGKLYCLLTVIGGGFGYLNALSWVFASKAGKNYPFWLMLLISLPAWGTGLYLHLIVDRIEKKQKDRRKFSRKVSDEIKEAILAETRELSEVNFTARFNKDENLVELIKQEDFDGALEYLDNKIEIANDSQDEAKLEFYEKCRRIIVQKKQFVEDTTTFFDESSTWFEHQILEDDDEELITDPRTRKYFRNKKRTKPKEDDEKSSS